LWWYQASQQHIASTAGVLNSGFVKIFILFAVTWHSNSHFRIKTDRDSGVIHEIKTPQVTQCVFYCLGKEPKPEVRVVLNKKGKKKQVLCAPCSALRFTRPCIPGTPARRPNNRRSPARAWQPRPGYGASTAGALHVTARLTPTCSCFCAMSPGCERENRFEATSKELCSVTWHILSATDDVVPGNRVT